MIPQGLNRSLYPVITPGAEIDRMTVPSHLQRFDDTSLEQCTLTHARLALQKHQPISPAIIREPFDIVSPAFQMLGHIISEMKCRGLEQSGTQAPPADDKVGAQGQKRGDQDPD